MNRPPDPRLPSTGSSGMARPLLLLLSFALLATPASNCRMSEFKCRRSSSCVRLDQVCDGRDDCGDRSDEPEGCTHCNRTFYGDVGRTYRLTIPRPRADRLPFVCVLTFQANQYELGDVAQLTLEEFKLGRFQSPHHRGCPDGHLSVFGGAATLGLGSSKLAAAHLGGQYCGRLPRGSPRPVFLSDDGDEGGGGGGRLVATVRFFQFSGDDPEDDFSLKLRYKFLPKREEQEQDQGGRSEKQVSLGDAIPGSTCSRVLSDCVHSACRVRSPGYPGVYPRNATCRFRVRVRDDDVPRGFRALVIISQRHSSRTSVRAEVVRKYGSEDRSLGLWSDCDALGDRVSVVDRQKTLIEFCRGASLHPPVVTSGPDATVVLATAPYGEIRPESDSADGLELDVGVMMVPRDDEHRMAFVQDSSECRFEISSPSLGSMRRGAKRSGVLRNVVHALPANTTCRYSFMGRQGELVWLTFLKFEVTHRKEDIYRAPDCTNRLALFDGKGESRRRRMGEFCENSPPRLCDQAFLTQEQLQNKDGERPSGPFRACTGANESYVSSGSSLTLMEYLGESTAVTAVDFVVRYEFVNTLQDGKEDKATDKDKQRWSCDRIFDSNSYAHAAAGSFLPFSSPTNVFLFGRGGRKDVSCSYTFRGRPGERVKLEINQFVAGKDDSNACRTRPHADLSGHFVCKDLGLAKKIGGGRARMWVSELPDGQTPLRQHCICQGVGQGSDQISPVAFLSNTSSLRVEFVVRGMTPEEDYQDFRLSGRFSFVHEPNCQLRRLAQGAGGRIALQPSYSSYCPDKPWVVEASRPGRFIFLKVPGVVVFSGRNAGGDGDSTPWDWHSGNFSSSPFLCETRNRVLVYSGRRLTIVCPSSNAERTVELFSDGWDEAKTHKLATAASGSNRRSSMVIKLVAADRAAMPAGGYSLQWLELSPTPEPNALSVFDKHNGGTDSLLASGEFSCAFACPELSGCIGAELWCDGVAHCPSGFDESEANCAHVFAPILYMYGAAAALFLVLALAVIVAVQRVRAAQDARQQRRRLQRHASSGSAICSSSAAGSANGGLAIYGGGGGGGHPTAPHPEESITNLAKEGGSCSYSVGGGSQYHLIQHTHPGGRAPPLNGSSTVVSSMDQVVMSSSDDITAAPADTGS